MQPQQVTKQFIAVRAVIIKDKKVLAIREAAKYSSGTNHGKYDFPGGKVKVGESIFDAIKREVKEEAGLENVEIGKPFFVEEWYPTVKGEKIQIIGIFYLCTISNTEIKLGSDHDDFQWIDPTNYLIPLMDANINALKEYLKQ